MELIQNLILVAILCFYLFFFLKSLRMNCLLEAIVLVSIVPTLMTMTGIESGKTLISLGFYSVLFIYGTNSKLKGALLGRKKITVPFVFSIFLFFLFVIIKIMGSSAMG